MPRYESHLAHKRDKSTAQPYIVWVDADSVLSVFTVSDWALEVRADNPGNDIIKFITIPAGSYNVCVTGVTAGVTSTRFSRMLTSIHMRFSSLFHK